MEIGIVTAYMRDPRKKWGFVQTSHGSVFFHYSNGRRPEKSVAGELPILVYDESLRQPTVGDILMLEAKPSADGKGPRTAVWAYEEDYHNALRDSLVSCPQSSTDIFDSVEFKTVTSVPGLVHGIKQAASVLKLSKEQISIFLRNTPNNKRGGELWEEFQQRQTKRNSDDYTFVTFFQEVLAAAGFPYVKIAC